MSRAPKCCGHGTCMRQAVPGTNRCTEHPKVPFAGSTRHATLPTDWATIRRRIIARDGGRCQWQESESAAVTPAICGAPGRQVDHVLPHHRGGNDDDANLMLLCDRHHGTKTGREARARQLEAS